jgi:hypothetical protein
MQIPLTVSVFGLPPALFFSVGGLLLEDLQKTEMLFRNGASREMLLTAVGV